MSLRVATIASDPEEEARLARELTAFEQATLVMRCVDRVEVLALARASSIDVIVMCGLPTWFDGELAQESVRAGIRLVGLAADPLEGERMDLLGAALIARGSNVEEILQAGRSAPVRPRDPVASPAGAGRVFSVWGPKGAPGRTTVALEIAHAFSRSRPSTVLVDGDPYGGDIVQLLGVVEELPTVVWAARRAARGESAQALADLRRAGSDGPLILPGLPRPELWADVSGFGWGELLGSLKDSFEVVVIDVGFCLEQPDDALQVEDGRNRMTLGALHASERVIAVFRADPVGIKNLLRDVVVLERSVDFDQILFVANRVEPGLEREVADLLKRHLGKRPVAYLPEDPRVGRSVILGQTLRETEPGSDLVRAVDVLAETLGARIRARGALARLAGRA